MKILAETFKNTGTLHHVYVIEGDREQNRPELFTFIEKTLKEPIQGNPDLWHGQFETFAIDDARALREHQSQKSFSDSRKLFVIEASQLTIEAQNALLKMFEEPTPNTHFFLLIYSKELLAPTVRSRVQIISAENTFEKQDMSQAKSFIQASSAERLKMVADIVEEKDREAAIKLVDNLIHVLHGKKSDPETLKNLLHCRGYLQDRSPSVKLLLEHLALTIS
jgi:DNA polymerase III gamma/tau subunit